jgi:starvation-inducible DNA-binding protein
MGKELSVVLADTYTLYLEAQYFHWNVKGVQFKVLHEAFEDLYNDLSQDVDVVAERIVQLEQRAPGTFKEFIELSSIDIPSDVPDAMDMVTKLVDDIDGFNARLRKLNEKTDAADDEATNDMIAERVQSQEKTAWMLRSMLK